ncbi:hypothetical protein ACWC9U_35945 [Streptomyces sp. 900116325]
MVKMLVGAVARNGEDYRLGPRMFSFGSRSAEIALREMVMPHLLSLATRTGTSSSLACSATTTSFTWPRSAAAAPGNIPYLKILHGSLAGTDSDLIERMYTSNEHVAARLAKAIQPVAERAGVPDPPALAIRIARFSTTYTGGAMLSSGYEAARLYREMAPLHGMVLMAIEAAAAGGRTPG